MTHVFDRDERIRIEVQADWTVETLLKQVGMVPLKDAIKILPIKSADVVRAYHELEKAGEDAYQVMGARQLWKSWILRMIVFAPFYRAKLMPKYQAVDPSWDSETALNQVGTFLLSEVHHLTPFTAHQLRHQCLLLKDSRQVMGVYKHPELKRYLVDMPVFRRWLQKIWTEGVPILPEQSPSSKDQQ